MLPCEGWCSLRQKALRRVFQSLGAFPRSAKIRGVKLVHYSTIAVNMKEKKWHHLKGRIFKKAWIISLLCQHLSCSHWCSVGSIFVTKVLQTSS